MLPNFFIVGAPKAGTSALYDYLGQHPAVYVSPIKEPAFFAADLLELKRQLGTPEADPDELRAWLNGPMSGRRSGVIDEWAQYLKLFKNVRHETAVGEVSANYLASHSAPRAIYERIPHARIIAVLRRHLRRSVVDALRRATHRRPQRLKRAERAAVLAIFASDIRELQDLLKRDLSAWMRA